MNLSCAVEAILSKLIFTMGLHGPVCGLDKLSVVFFDYAKHSRLLIVDGFQISEYVKK